ncbi:MAG TPA: SRPBCC domain-containing protein [Candidatus Binataceae bacterium]|nr:SRPBCC domain-containing protein [Candidatus Binataceae bacterium]
MSSRILVALRVAATPERAFEVFTREIGTWWRNNSLFQFTRRKPGILSFEPGPSGRLIETQPDGAIFEIGRIMTWEPGVRLAFNWRQESFTAEQMTRVEVRFEPVGDETRVTVEHHGWDTIPAEHVARHGFPGGVFLRRHGEWWQALLVSYQAKLQSDI